MYLFLVIYVVVLLWKQVVCCFLVVHVLLVSLFGLFVLKIVALFHYHVVYCYKNTLLK